MKKVLSFLCVTVLAVVSVFGLTGCNKSNLVKPKKQLDAIMEVCQGKADAAIVDYTMANYCKNKGQFAGKIAIVEDIEFPEEVYGVGFRKESKVLPKKVNNALYELQENGKLGELVDKWNLQNNILEIPKPKDYNETDTDADWEYIKSKGKIVLGYTIYPPLTFKNKPQDSDDNIIGFDIELAKLVFGKLGLQVDPYKIENWARKVNLINDNSIDCIWNGFTKSEEAMTQFSFTDAYLNNKQVVVVKTENVDKYKDKESLKKAIIAVEDGSAGQDTAEKLLGIK